MRYFKRLICIFIPIIGFALNACANSADNDLLLFSISLNDDTTSIYGCHWDDRIKTNLSGPVLMEKGTLL
ncbi:MAG: hypothetical protein GX089_08655, partial [Fibrobacter sp.]|nr:hypothetical protein [Fibrobacter sp.]